MRMKPKSKNRSEIGPCAYNLKYTLVERNNVKKRLKEKGMYTLHGDASLKVIDIIPGPGAYNIKYNSTEKSPVKVK